MLTVEEGDETSASVEADGSQLRKSSQSLVLNGTVGGIDGGRRRSREVGSSILHGW